VVAVGLAGERVGEGHLQLVECLLESILRNRFGRNL
jgi:hypothetical protein